MVNLTNTCILVRTKEENEMLLKEAEKKLKEMKKEK